MGPPKEPMAAMTEGQAEATTQEPETAGAWATVASQGTGQAMEPPWGPWGMPSETSRLMEAKMPTKHNRQERQKPLDLERETALHTHSMSYWETLKWVWRLVGYYKGPY